MIERTKWENLWADIEMSVLNWKCHNEKHIPNNGRLIFEDGSKLGCINWLHHYSSNYEGVAFNKITIYYSPLQEDNKYFLHSKLWEKEGKSAKHDITKKQIEALKNSVEKFILKEIEIK